MSGTISKQFGNGNESREFLGINSLEIYPHSDMFTAKKLRKIG